MAFKIGCHLSSAGGYMAMGQTAVSIGANVFQFFTRNPRGGAAKPIDPADVAAFRDYAAEKGIGPILAHAPYTLNAASGDSRIRDFAESVFTDDLKRLESTPGAMYNFHPGAHTGLGAEQGVANICDLLVRVFANVGGAPSTTVLLETMSGKGSEIGRNFGELRAIIDQVESHLPGPRLPVPRSPFPVPRSPFPVPRSSSTARLSRRCAPHARRPSAPWQGSTPPAPCHPNRRKRGAA